MKKITLCCFLFCISFLLNAQCTISPFIQQNYEFDAKLLVLREIQNDVNDPDYDNPFLSQARVDHHLEKLSTMYENPQNDVNIDSLFNEFQFHAYVGFTKYKEMRFHVDTNISWVQTLKDTGQSGVTVIDDFFTQYQFTLSMYTDINAGSNAGKTQFVITTGYDFINIYALFDDLVATAPGVIEVDTGNVVTENPCNYIGIPYQIPDMNGLPVVDRDVVSCDIFAPTFYSNGAYIFSFSAYCLASPVNQSRYVIVSDDCSLVTFSRTLSTEDLTLTNFAIYPNPTSDKLQLQGITSIQDVEIYSILGTAINIPLDVSQNTVNVSSLKNGVYFLKVVDGQNRSVIRKFIKK